MSLGNGTYHPAHITFWDKSKEKSRFEVFGAPVTATYVDPDVVNFTAQSVAWAALYDAAVALVLGLPYAQQWVNEVIINANPAQSAINQLAVRETKLMIQYIDNTTQKPLTTTLPTVNLALLTYLPQAKDFVAITNAQGAGTEVVAFVTAFEGYARNPAAASNAITVVGLKVVGRNI